MKRAREEEEASWNLEEEEERLLLGREFCRGLRCGTFDDWFGRAKRVCVEISPSKVVEMFRTDCVPGIGPTVARLRCDAKGWAKGALDAFCKDFLATDRNCLLRLKLSGWGPDALDSVVWGLSNGCRFLRRLSIKTPSKTDWNRLGKAIASLPNLRRLTVRGMKAERQFAFLRELCASGSLICCLKMEIREEQATTAASVLDATPIELPRLRRISGCELERVRGAPDLIELARDLPFVKRFQVRGVAKIVALSLTFFDHEDPAMQGREVESLTLCGKTRESTPGNDVERRVFSRMTRLKKIVVGSMCELSAESLESLFSAALELAPNLRYVRSFNPSSLEAVERAFSRKPARDFVRPFRLHVLIDASDEEKTTRMLNSSELVRTAERWAGALRICCTIRASEDSVPFVAKLLALPAPAMASAPFVEVQLNVGTAISRDHCSTLGKAVGRCQWLKSLWGPCDDEFLRKAGKSLSIERLRIGAVLSRPQTGCLAGCFPNARFLKQVCCWNDRSVVRALLEEHPKMACFRVGLPRRKQSYFNSRRLCPTDCFAPVLKKFDPSKLSSLCLRALPATHLYDFPPGIPIE